MPRRSPIPPGGDPQEHPALKGGHVVIISGEKPIYKQNMQGPQGHAALGNILEQKGFEYEPVSGKYNGQKQPGYIVHVRNDNEDETLKDIAKRMGQEAIVHSESNKHQYVYTGGTDEGKATPPSSGIQWFGDQEPEDNYTTLFGPSGEPLGHFSYVLDFGNSLVPHGRGQMVDVPEAARQVLKAAVESYRGILLDLRKREVEKTESKLGVRAVTLVDRLRGGVPTKKYEVEAKRATSHGPKPVSDDISAQGFAGKPTNPNNDLITGGGPIKHVQPGGHNGSVTRKAEEGDYARINSVRRREHEELSTIPWHDPDKPWKPTSDAPVPSLAEERAAAAAKTRKSENPMKLHDLMKAQALNKGGSDMSILRGMPPRKPSYQREPPSGGWTTGSAAQAIHPEAQVRRGEKRPPAPGAVPSLETIRTQVASGEHPEMGRADDFYYNECDTCHKEIPEGQPMYQEGYEDDPDVTLCANCAPERVQLQEQEGVARRTKLHNDYTARAEADRQARAAVGGEVNQALENIQPAGGILKREPQLKLHDLMKAQVLRKPPVSESQRAAMGAAASGHSTLGIPKSVGKEFINADKGGKLPEVKKGTLEAKLGTGKKDPIQAQQPVGANMPMGKAQCTCGQPGCMYCGSGKKPKQSNEQGEHGYSPKKPSYQPGDETKKAEYHPTPSYQSSRDVSSPHSDGSSLSVNRPSHPFSDPARSTTGGSMVIKNSIFKKVPEGLDKAETIAHASAKRNGGTIKLGKQEFYIDLANASDSKKRLRETNPVKESVVPGGKETGWQTNGPKPKTIERSASGGAIKGNAPKAGPDQKNTAENSVTEGALKPKVAPKNDLIEKASEDFHKRTGGRFQKKPASDTTPASDYYDEKSKTASGVHSSVAGEVKKAAPSMAAPKAPSAPGAGSPSMSAKPPMKPPTAPAGGAPMGGFGKAEFGIKQGAQQGSFDARSTAPTAPAPKATPQPPSAYDPSLYQPSAPVKSGLLTQGDFTAAHAKLPGVGVTPKPAAPIRSPAQHRGITGFLGKGELCKACGKAHPMGKCA